MSKAFFVVRAVVEDGLREKFDRWYAIDHLPSAMAAFKAEKAWRFWSTVDAGVHYAFYQFTDMAKLEAGVNPQSLKPLIADFDKTWPACVTRARDILNMVEERSA